MVGAYIVIYKSKSVNYSKKTDVNLQIEFYF